MLCLCTCPTQFPMVRVGDNGKYKVGDKLIIFVRILRRHIMVRVGGGWQELSEFLRMKDPCRCKSPSSSLSSNSHHHHQFHPSGSPQQASSATAQPAKVNPSNPRSRLVESSLHLNRGYHQHHNFRDTSSAIPTATGGQRLISGSASMSWLSHNS